MLLSAELSLCLLMTVMMWHEMEIFVLNKYVSYSTSLSLFLGQATLQASIRLIRLGCAASSQYFPHLL
jgi:hypothetical protein